MRVIDILEAQTSDYAFLWRNTLPSEAAGNCWMKLFKSGPPALPIQKGLISIIYTLLVQFKTYTNYKSWTTF